MQSVALLGLGTMGAGMARSLARAGYPLSVWNRNRARAEPFAAAGARVGNSPRDAATGADVIIAMVADDAASRAVWLGDSGALAGARAGAIAIESSTLTPAWIRELAHAVDERCGDFLDAPVTGSRTHADAGELLFLVGGDAAVLERVRAPLAAMSRGVVHLGPTGSGALVKLVNNFVAGVQVAALAEAVAVIERSGLAQDAALGILLDGAPGSPIVKTVARRMLERDYSVNFALALMRKDLTYAIAEGARFDVPLETAAAALRSFERALTHGLGAHDMAAIVEPLRTSPVHGHFCE
jgi:3-hydroxyisobutyrate dehydrogenase